MKRYVLFISLVFNFIFAKTGLLNDSSTHFTFNILNNIPTLELDQSINDSIQFIVIDDAYYDIRSNVAIPYLLYKIALTDTIQPQITIANIQWEPSDITIMDTRNIENNNIYEIADIGLAGKSPTMMLRINPLKIENGVIKYLKNATVTITQQTNKNAKKIQLDYSYLNGNNVYALPVQILSKKQDIQNIR